MRRIRLAAALTGLVALAALPSAADAQAVNPGRNAADVLAGVRGVPTIEYDVSKLPPAVKALRDELIAAARSGDIEKLRPIVKRMKQRPDFGAGDAEDPIEFLKQQSGDGEGFEQLAILQEILEAGFVHVDRGTPEEAYVWPYFARYPILSLTKPQMIELFKIITGGEWADAKDFGAYTFYRTAIGPDGAWHYFLAGD
ncbi:MAG: hypothetical protein U1E56_00170 [Bauldia sp.]